MSSSIRFQSYLPQSTHSQLLEMASSLRVPAAEIVRRAVNHYVEHQQKKQPSKKSTTPKTFSQLAKQLEKIPVKPGRFASKDDKLIYET